MQSRDSSPAEGAVLARTSLILLSVALAALELFIPRIPLLPWLKPGLANVVAIVWIVRFGVRDALLYSLVRTWITGFYFGFSLITLALGLSGAVAAIAGMGLVWRLAGQRGLVGLVGLGIVGATCHNAGQLAAAYFLLARNNVILYQLPAMAVASAVFGGLVGVLSRSLLGWNPDARGGAAQILPSLRQGPSRGQLALSCTILVWSIVTMFLHSCAALGASALAATTFTQIILRGSPDALWRPVRSFWFLIATVAAIHLCFTYGRSVPGVPWLTHEGIAEARDQTLRLWTWLQLSQLLRVAAFDTIVLRVLRFGFRRHDDTLSAAMLALEYFPQTLERARPISAAFLAELFRRPRHALAAAMGALQKEVAAAASGPASDSRSATNRAPEARP